MPANLEPIEEGDLDLKNKFLGGDSSAQEGLAVEKSISGIKGIRDLESLGMVNIEKKEERSSEKERTYSKILSKVKTTQNPTDDTGNTISSDASDVMSEAEAKIDKLIKLAMNKGVVHAVKVAKHMEDNYALDEFHDRLMADEFHEALVKKGLIKEL